MPFSATWNEIQKRLSGGMTIPNWTYNNQFNGKTILIVSVNSNNIEVDPQSGAPIKRVSQGDFLKIYNVWASYCNGQSSRSKVISPLSKNSRHIINVLKWLEQQLGRPSGSLP
jgi:hypothetical protein